MQPRSDLVGIAAAHDRHQVLAIGERAVDLLRQRQLERLRAAVAGRRVGRVEERDVEIEVDLARRRALEHDVVRAGGQTVQPRARRRVRHAAQRGVGVFAVGAHREVHALAGDADRRQLDVARLVGRERVHEVVAAVEAAGELEVVADVDEVAAEAAALADVERLLAADVGRRLGRACRSCASSTTFADCRLLTIAKYLPAGSARMPHLAGEAAAAFDLGVDLAAVAAHGDRRGLLGAVDAAGRARQRDVVRRVGLEAERDVVRAELAALDGVVGGRAAEVDRELAAGADVERVLAAVVQRGCRNRRARRSGRRSRCRPRRRRSRAELLERVASKSSQSVPPLQCQSASPSPSKSRALVGAALVGLVARVDRAHVVVVAALRRAGAAAERRVADLVAVAEHAVGATAVVARR